ncbi:MAG: PIN domain-containing protein [Thermoanaerobaculia bacterium]
MRLLVDTDVLLDMALDREPFASAAAALFDALELRPGAACIAWHTASNFYYLASPKRGKTDVRDLLKELTRFIEVAPTTTASLLEATELAMADFEDAMQVAAALAFRADLIATRNVKDFAASPIPAVKPETALVRLLGG